MLIANFIIIIFSLFFSLYFSLRTSEYLPNTTTVPIVQNIHLAENIDHSVPLPAKQLLASFNQYSERHEGFLGFINLITIREISQTVTVIPPIYTTDDEIEIEKTPLSFSIDDGDETGIYISDETEFTYFPQTKKKAIKPISRGVQVIRRVKAAYPWVAYIDGKEGEVSTLVYIDSLGYLSMFPDWIVGDDIHIIEYIINGELFKAQYAYSEEPQGWFFAQNFLKVLSDWRFAPKIKNGKPVGALLRIKCIFCIGFNNMNCMRYELEQVTSSKELN